VIGLVALGPRSYFTAKRYRTARGLNCESVRIERGVAFKRIFVVAPDHCGADLGFNCNVIRHKFHAFQMPDNALCFLAFELKEKGSLFNATLLKQLRISYLYWALSRIPGTNISQMPASIRLRIG
jgi:hypothetical protein